MVNRSEIMQSCTNGVWYGDGVALLRFYLSIHSNLIFVKIFIYAPLTGSTDGWAVRCNSSSAQSSKLKAQCSKEFNCFVPYNDLTKQPLPAHGGKRPVSALANFAAARSSWLQEDDSWRRRTSHGGKRQVLLTGNSIHYSALRRMSEGALFEQLE